MSRTITPIAPAGLPWPAFFDDPRRACAGAEPNLFFPEKGGLGIGEAKAICARCPVRDECREYAITFEAFGIWAGTTPDEREQERRARRRARDAA